VAETQQGQTQLLIVVAEVAVAATAKTAETAGRAKLLSDI
jgi:hypothetical protein